MKTLFLQIKVTVDAVKGKTTPPPEKTSACIQQYRHIVDRAFEPYLTELLLIPRQNEVKNLLDRFDKYQTENLRFMVGFRVLFDNNLAGRDIRMAKVKQKISSAFRSNEGTRFFCQIRGSVSTLKKQNCYVLEELTQTFKLNPNQASWFHDFALNVGAKQVSSAWGNKKTGL